MDPADDAMVYFNPRTVAHKKLPEINPQQIKAAFGKKGLRVYDDAERLIRDLHANHLKKSNLLIMTSGNFDGQDLESLARRIIQKEN
jgi:UDP-N-acetylmuramate: L-alanyl-gamma-D-glutamyl-meso-diaminopimelate ligase